MKRAINVIEIALLLLVFFANPYTLFAQDKTSSLIVPVPTIINYSLPYPGLLPDSPLYFLKAIRDRIVVFSISDPLKKAQFNLLTADKHLNASLYLFNEHKGKDALAQTTISKGENYFSEAISDLQTAQKQGEDIHELSKTMAIAAAKHQQVLQAVIKTINPNQRVGIQNSLNRVNGFVQVLSHITKNK